MFEIWYKGNSCLKVHENVNLFTKWYIANYRSIAAKTPILIEDHTLRRDTAKFSVLHILKLQKVETYI